MVSLSARIPQRDAASLPKVTLGIEDREVACFVFMSVILLVRWRCQQRQQVAQRGNGNMYLAAVVPLGHLST